MISSDTQSIRLSGTVSETSYKIITLVIIIIFTDMSFISIGIFAAAEQYLSGISIHPFIIAVVFQGAAFLVNGDNRSYGYWRNCKERSIGTSRVISIISFCSIILIIFVHSWCLRHPFSYDVGISVFVGFLIFRNHISWCFGGTTHIRNCEMDVLLQGTSITILVFIIQVSF